MVGENLAEHGTEIGLAIQVTAIFGAEDVPVFPGFAVAVPVTIAVPVEPPPFENLGQDLSAVQTTVPFRWRSAWAVSQHY